MVVTHHLVVACDVAHRVPDRRALAVLYADSVLRAEVSNQPRRLDQHVIVVAQVVRVATCLPKDRRPRGPIPPRARCRSSTSLRTLRAVYRAPKRAVRILPSRRMQKCARKVFRVPEPRYARIVPALLGVDRHSLRAPAGQPGV